MSSSPHQGLSPEEVEASRSRYGANSLTPPKRESLWRKFWRKFEDPIILILLVAMLLSLGVSSYEYFVLEERALSLFLEPAGVLLAVLLSTGIAFYFELRSEREFEVLSQVSEEVYYKVYRAGELQQVLKGDLVVGDLVLLEAGEQIPADGILLESVAMEVDESTLTGEPIVAKSARAEDFDPEATYPTNHLYRGTTLLDGHGLYRIDRVGDATEYGRVFEGAQLETEVQTPLSRQLDGLAKVITQVSYGIAALVLLGSVLLYALDGGFTSFSWPHALGFFLQKVMIAVTVIVVAVPEGLPMSVTLSLAYSMRSMMKTNNLVRRMHACETMGATTVICTDKTGTLTQNKMHVVATHFAPEIASELLQLALAVNSTAHLDRHSTTTPHVLGNPTEGALLLWLDEQGVDYDHLRAAHPVQSQLPFSTERKYMATVIDLSGKRILLVKGAPEVVLQHCLLTSEERRPYEEELARYQVQAMRTIAFAYRELDEEPPFADGRLAVGDLTLLGIVGISDPIRPEVPEAIRQCLDAGIQVKIVTGDVSGTAKEIGRQIGLWDDATCTEEALITGTEFAQLSDEELLERIPKLRIMSRARPMDKERLVRLLQQLGEVVAVTGDGTNDAPALNRAHVGLSMGDGTSVAKEASDITILDNSFASITQAVLWGRSLYQNIQRFILFQMTINVAACLLVLLGAFIGTESPLTVTQMLWVNLIMDTFAALALASLPPDRLVMKARPRRQTEHIITPAMSLRIFGIGGCFVLILLLLIQYFGHSELTHLDQFSWRGLLASLGEFSEGTFSAYELSVFFSIFVFLQFWNLFNAKSFLSDRSAFQGLSKQYNFLLILGLIFLGQLLITSFGGTMFRVAPLDGVTWCYILLGTSAVLWIGELVRLFSRSRH